jgi:hypothetical protein
MKIIKQIIKLFEKQDKVKLFGVFLLMLLGGLLEMLGVGLIFPEVRLITLIEKHQII